MRLASVLILTGLLAAPHAYAAEFAPEPSGNADAIGKKRLYRSQTSLYRILALPRYALELPWYPAKRFLDFSERTDLFARATDLFYFNEAKTSGWFPKFSSGESSGGAGLSLFHHDLFKKKHQANISFSYAAEDEFFGRAAYTVDPTPDSSYYLKVESDYIRDRDIEIYTTPTPSGGPILGAKTLRSDRRSYAFTSLRGKLTAGKKMSKTVRMAAFVRGARSKAGHGAQGFAPVPTNAPGFGESVGMAGGGMELIWDFRNDPVRPFYGCLVQAHAEALGSGDSTAAGDRFAYVGHSLTAEHYFPLYDPHRTLVFRHSLRRVDPIGDKRIPFYDLPRLDENHLLRSFERNRFQDRGALSFNMEYRYPIWVTWDAFFFFDGGQSFEHYSDLHGPDFRFSEGLGIRMMSKDKLLFVTQYAHGREGGRFQVLLGQAF
ncbi:MAG: hypothetical protein CO113_15410 [Elusimicrobia bacterium CG_4_9_14_3_um_filter_62_55]|nr:MAG: hypothetical protein COR54_08650 [Elusimicrobia bacterium CG22_combo_CG10-13_8_21_14_all_63_91]PJA11454.1 MAG: hypothetical protein COX66_19840 [Elusimicrobia bacterium CG_4_10_14_0_2_um_filter_63_34]PJB24159.1 MAG: hypothetical protein CO113_15410 [Elusimicrobia bacterium CG_4_9_14_3_um_filter_62_55]